MNIAAFVLSMATALISGWMAMMYLVLRHAQYEERLAMAAVICAGAVALAAGVWRLAAPLRWTMLVWSIGVGLTGVWALLAPTDDGWTIIAGLVFVLQGVVGAAQLLSRQAATA